MAAPCGLHRGGQQSEEYPIQPPATPAVAIGQTSAGRHQRRRGDFARAAARVLDDLPPGTILTMHGARLLGTIAAGTCGAHPAGVFRVTAATQCIERMDGAGTPDAALANELVAIVARNNAVRLGKRLLVARLWPWDAAETVKSVVCLALAAPPEATFFAFTQTDKRRLATLVALVALREGAHEQREAATLLRQGTRAMAGTTHVERRLADIADAITAATGAEQVAIWM